MAPLLTFVAALAALGAASAAPLPSVATTKTGDHSLRGGRQLQTLMCNSIGCSNGFIPIVDAMNTVCIGGTCEESQCCEAFCSFHACPNGFVPILDAATTMCSASGCTTDLCCDDGSNPAPTPTDDDDTTMTFADDDDDLSFSFSFGN